ncbi:hypothetical protein C8Q73DRAFT_421166 [Cubamyces lactineus]|nr:hypothetical protein C8Q73DRAFT_421166 [Cubamyces lactineus]
MILLQIDHSFLRSPLAGACLGLLYESGHANGTYFAGSSTEFGTAWNSLTFSFNVIVTTLIIINMGHRYTFSDEGRRVYTGAMAIVIKSALPFTIGSMTYMITYGIGSDVAVGFSCYSMLSTISPMLIALRVLTRRTRRKEQASGFLTTVDFSAPRAQNTLAQDGHKADFDIEEGAEAGSSFDPLASHHVNSDCTV